ncbi:Autophagy-related protein 27 [Dioscorea alata]|uniref:Autophagy-related protein 27 n=2 Tax=Dioscorea alata TaxID=55571 RepID=A0ACB7U8T1_DIOAL|nr:Autophagy-related protein 27 [Dioscorea alata]
MPSPERGSPTVAAAVVPWLLVSLVVGLTPLPAVGTSCDLSFLRGNTLYNYSLALPIKNYPHGALSEDGFYKVAVNTSLLWFQLCDSMIFNHDPPRCFSCQGCGGPSGCGTACSALVSNDIRGYFVCTTLGQPSNIDIKPIDEDNPQKGVIVKMSAIGLKDNCSLSVSVFCDRNEAQPPNSLDMLGECNYATVLRHPSGCPKIISANGGGWGWFSILMIILLCLFGGYLLAGTVYRFFFLGIHGVEAIPNLEFWVSLPQRAWIGLSSLIRRFRGNAQNGRGYSSRVDF